MAIKENDNTEQMMEYIKELEAEMLRIQEENQMLIDELNKR